MLQYLQGLLTGKQGQQNQEYGSNLALQNAAMAQQGSQFNQNLAQQGNEFNATTALQQKAQDEANQIAQEQFGLGQNAQQFQQGVTNQELGQSSYQSSPGYLALLSMLQSAPKTAAATTKPISSTSVTFPGGTSIPGFFY